MGNTFHAVMSDLVAGDAARLSGQRFADVRGASIARRVRTRRTVKAAGVGGASVVAVGALAVGAINGPWGNGSLTPSGLWADGCTPTAVQDVDAIWENAVEPRAHVIDVSSEYEAETWYLYDDTLEMIVLLMAPGAEGLDVIFADGARELVIATGTGVYEFEAPGGGWVTFDPADTVHHAIWHADEPTELSRTETLADVTPPFAFQWTGCGFGSPSGSADPNVSVGPSPSPDPTPVSKPDGPTVTPTMTTRVITSLPYETANDVWLASGGERVALFSWRQASDGLVTLRASEEGEGLSSLEEYTVAVVGGIARVPVGDMVVRVRVDSDDTVTVESVESVEAAGAQASIGEPTSGVIDPWFSLVSANTIDLDEVVGG
jgi:hypothetical protein